MGYFHLDGTLVTEEVLGAGGSGVVIRKGQTAVKIPRLWHGVDIPEDGTLTPEAGDFDMWQFRIEQMNREKLILRRLRDCKGIIPCSDLDAPDFSIQMSYMEKGDLREYLAREKPNRETQLAWFIKMAHTLSDIHRRRVIVADLRFPT